MSNHKYKPVVFTAGGENGVCSDRHFEVRKSTHGTCVGWSITETTKSCRTHIGYSANLGTVKADIEALVNQEA